MSLLTSHLLISSEKCLNQVIKVKFNSTKYQFKSHAPPGVYIIFKKHTSLVSNSCSGINFVLTYKANYSERKVIA